MATVSNIDLDQAMLDPASVFTSPKDVLEAHGLSPETKKAILARWEEDVEALIRATEEGMLPEDNRRNPGEMLRAVQAALQTL